MKKSVSSTSPSFNDVLCTVLCIPLLLMLVQAQPAPKPSLGPEAIKWWVMAEEEVRRATQLPPREYKPSKNVIVFLGDGMGQTTLTAARNLKAHMKGRLAGEETLSVDSFPYTGYSKTYNSDYQVPDSAGTASAYLCGVKANMGTLGVDERVQKGDWTTHRRLQQQKDSGVDLKCIAHYASEAGKSVGVVTNQPLTDASPVPNFGHAADRKWQGDQNLSAEARADKYMDLAAQFVHFGQHVDISLSGGFAYFDASRRNDTQDLLTLWKENKKKSGKNPAVVRTRDDLMKLDVAKLDAVFGLFADYAFQYSKWRREAEPTLAEMTRRALEFLQSRSSSKEAAKADRGYYLFVEGGLIDYGHHFNFGAHALFDTLAFDEAIQVARNMTSPDDTTIIVTADHSHVFTYAGYARREVNILGFAELKQEPTKDNKSYTMIMYANGPGFYPNHKSITDPDGKKYYERRDLADPNEKFNMSDYSYRYLTPVPVDYETHGGEDVPIYAFGPGSHLFSGVHEQHAIPHLLYCAACFGPYHTECPCAKGGRSAGAEGGISRAAGGGAAVVVVVLLGIALVLLVALCIYLLRQNGQLRRFNIGGELLMN